MAKTHRSDSAELLSSFQKQVIEEALLFFYESKREAPAGETEEQREERFRKSVVAWATRDALMQANFVTWE